MKTILITGGAGFIGYHLANKLLDEGESVIIYDNLSTGNLLNVKKLQDKFKDKVVFIKDDVCSLKVNSSPPFDECYHLACHASPSYYLNHSLSTISTAYMGTYNVLFLCSITNKPVLIASTSEIYGDPLISPQHESYWGNVNPVGKRACYNEGKRAAETLASIYKNDFNLDVKIARIFNTYGPVMNASDGRCIPEFIKCALNGQNLVVYEGYQTRSFCYVEDTVDGLISLMKSNYKHPVNIGNPDERSIISLAYDIKEKCKSASGIVFMKKREDDPRYRKPDITTAKKILNWSPKVKFEDGLNNTIEYFKKYLNR